MVGSGSVFQLSSQNFLVDSVGDEDELLSPETGKAPSEMRQTVGESGVRFCVFFNQTFSA